VSTRSRYAFSSVLQSFEEVHNSLAANKKESHSIDYLTLLRDLITAGFPCYTKPSALSENTIELSKSCDIVSVVV
jgi:hypothetical protein